MKTKLEMLEQAARQALEALEHHVEQTRPIHSSNTRKKSEHIANAKLIAAAPELLEALKQMVSIVVIHSNATGNNFAWAELDEARAAIAKCQ